MCFDINELKQKIKKKNTKKKTRDPLFNLELLKKFSTLNSETGSF
jgi:hypothetical protein